MPEQYCIGNKISKSACNCINWGGSNNKYHHTNIHASVLIFLYKANKVSYSHNTLALVLRKLES